MAIALPSILDGGSAAGEMVVEHVGECLRCQAELAKYRKLLRLLNQLRSSRVEPPPGTVDDVLGADRAGRPAPGGPLCAQRAPARLCRSGRRSRGRGRRGGTCAPGRLRRVRPVVLS